jgi:hypothetical protein
MTAYERNQMVEGLFWLGMGADDIAYFIRASIAGLSRYQPGAPDVKTMDRGVK